MEPGNAIVAHPDDLEYGAASAIARWIRRFRPEVLLTATYELTYGMAAGQRIVNQADHRAVGVAVLDAARDAGNRWIFPDLLDEGFEPWAGVHHVYLMGSNQPTHGVDVTDSLDAGIASLRAHEAYLRGLGRDFDPEQFLRAFTAAAGASIGVRHAVALAQVQLQGV
ncbi:MAG TPA: hypothetical protein VIW24_09175 [Aldersonia sp.]